jgi:hypothetical protein
MDANISPVLVTYGPPALNLKRAQELCDTPFIGAVEILELKQQLQLALAEIAKRKKRK